MTHEPSWKMGEGHDAFCTQAMGRWDGGCQCEFLAKVRADERQRQVPQGVHYRTGHVCPDNNCCNGGPN